MLIKEYRIPMPLSVDEYQRGQLYSVAEASKNETGGGEGVEVVKQEPFTSDKVRPGQKLSGMYTYKIYGLKSKMPWIFRKLLPDAATVLHEESWNAYPYCKTVVTNPGYMKENFYVILESIHLPDNGTTENALGIDKAELKKREVVMLDLWDEQHLVPKDTKVDTNPRTFKSTKTGRGPLVEGWQDTTQPIMCCYKLCRVHFKWFGLQTKVEKTAHKNYPRLFLKFHREIFCWIDAWYELTLEDIRKIEAETAEQLKKQFQEGEVRGMKGGGSAELAKHD